MDLFVYGTLRCHELMTAIAGAAVASKPATLHGYAVHPVADHIVPMIRPALDAVAEGCLYLDIGEEIQFKLDLYEGAFGYALISVDVQTDQGPRQAKMYLPPVDQPFDDRPWSLADWEKDHLAPTLLTVDEIFRRDPLPSKDWLRDRWAIIEKRAWAKHRASKDTVGAATLRHQPNENDATILQQRAPQGEFFQLQSFEVSHRQFRGKHSGALQREVFVGTDAGLILPYDAKRDRVLLVEQLRMGPLLRQDPNPWALEPIAGMVDAREDPLKAAIREGYEEAGLTFHATESMPHHYPSPGGSTDFFYCYLGLCDLPNLDSYTGGLIDEAEDLRLHTLPFDDAMSLIETGEIRIGVLIMMLYWLGRERDRLRKLA